MNCRRSYLSYTRSLYIQVASVPKPLLNMDTSGREEEQEARGTSRRREEGGREEARSKRKQKHAKSIGGAEQA